MAAMKSPAYMAAHIRRVILDGASAPHAEEVQRFFKEEVASRGWYTAELRKAAFRFQRVLLKEHGMDYLVAVADQLFRGRVQEEKNIAVMLLEKSVHDFGPRQFRLFDEWLDRVTTWSDHDGLLHYLIGPMIADEPARARVVFTWARSPSRWRRRASAVALIRGARRRMFDKEIARVTELLLDDQDDMVQKGLGWLLREYAKYNPGNAVKLLMTLRGRSPRLVLRTACETLDAKTRAKVLAKTAVAGSS